jgi:DnaJ-class molecular chaperone
MDPRKRKEYDEHSTQSRKDSNDLQDLWRKRSGVTAADAAKEEEATPISWVKNKGATTTPSDESSNFITQPLPIHGSQANSGYSSGPNASVSASQPHATSGAPPKAEGQSVAPSLEIELTVNLREAVKGCPRELVITDNIACQDCAGLKPVMRMQCQNCHGVGTYNINRKERVDLPPRMHEGFKLTLPGQGRFDMRTGRKGDLVIKIKVAPFAPLGINGNDVTLTVPVTLYEALLGAEITIPSAAGKVTMKIQPLTQPGRVYRLKGMGLAGADQLVTIEVVLPSKLSPEDAAAFKRLRENYNEPNPRQSLFAH